MASKATLALAIVAIGVAAMASERLLGLLGNTALLAFFTLAIALPLGAVGGVFLAKTDLAGRRVAAWLAVGMLFVPLYVQAAAWNAIIGPGGWATQSLAGEGYANAWFTGWRAAVWIHAMGALPWVALLTAASLSTVERRLEEESLLDASPLRVLGWVSVRRGAGGLWAAAVWTAVVCATEIAVTDLYQIRTFAEEIYTQASLGPLSGASPGLLGTDLAIGVMLIALLTALALRLTTPWLPRAAAIEAGRAWQWRPAGGRVALTLAAWSLIAAATVLPLAGLVFKAGMAVHQVGNAYVRSWSLVKAASMVLESPWQHRREWGWSLAIGACAAGGTAVVGIAVAWAARVRPLTAAPLALVVAAGMAVPAPLLGVWLIALLNQPADSPIRFLTVLYDRTLLAPVVVQLVRAVPLATLWMWSQFRSLPQDVLEAARSDGAGSVAQLFRMGLPLRPAGAAAALVMGLILAMGEISATLLVTPPGVTTISVRVFQLLHYGVDDRVAALALSIFAALGAAVALAAQGRRWRIFRNQAPLR